MSDRTLEKENLITKWKYYFSYNFLNNIDNVDMIMPTLREILKDRHMIFINLDNFVKRRKKTKTQLFADILVDSFQHLNNVFLQMHILVTLRPFLGTTDLATFSQICKHIGDTVEKRKIPSGDMVGIVAAQSISERFTQTTLNSFHIAGSKKAAAQMGISRVVELLDALKLLKQPIVKNVHTKYPTRDIFERTLANSSSLYSIYYALHNLNLYYHLDLDKYPYSPYVLMFQLEDTLVVHNMLYKTKFYKDTRGIIHFTFMDVHWKYYPEVELLMGYVDKRLGLHLIKHKFRNIAHRKICGAPLESFEDGTLFFKHGTMLHKTFTLQDIFEAFPDVDLTRVIPNDIHFIYQNFGIEAVRNYLLKELPTVLAQEGIHINIRHIMLLVDNMTAEGYVRPNKFSGIKNSVLLKASFEQATRTLATAASLNQKDTLQNVSAQIIMGLLVKSGSNQSKMIPQQTSTHEPMQIDTPHQPSPPSSPEYFPASPIYEDQPMEDVVEPTFFV